MVKRLGSLASSLLFVIAVAIVVAATTLASSYRDCLRSHQPLGAPPEATGGPLHGISAFVDCEGKFLEANASTLTAMALLSIAFFAFALQRSTARLWQAGERHLAIAEKAVESARLGAQAAMGAERAHLLVNVKASNLDKPLENARLEAGPEPDIATPVEPPCIDYVLSNVGRTAALLRDVRHALAWDSPEGLRSYHPGEAGLLELVAPQSDSRVMRCRFRGDFTSREARALVAGTRALLFYGDASFVDAFGQVRGVKWQCRCTGGNFDLIGFQEVETGRAENSSAA